MARSKRNGSMVTYRSYSFVDKDPVIDKLRTIVQREGFIGGGGFRKLSRLSGVSQASIYNWFNGATRRPQNASIEAVARAMGYRRGEFEKVREINFEATLKRIGQEE
jgi:transcriptional regulator with XRE-family HTH domain